MRTFSAMRLIRTTALLLALLSALSLCACTGSPNIAIDPSQSGNGTTVTPSAGTTVTPTPDGSSAEPTPSGDPVTPTPSDDPVTPTPSDDPVTPTPSDDPVTPTPEPTPTPTPTPTPVEPVKTVEVSAKNVRHVFTHCLINDPKKGCGYDGAPLDVDCLTVSEFEKLLQSLYDNDFVLIDINDMYVVDENGKAKLADTVTVPEGKKPLVVSIDDVVYDPRKRGSGMIDRLVIENGTIMGLPKNLTDSVVLTPCVPEKT